MSAISYLLCSLIKAAFLLDLFLVPLQVLHHQVLSRQLEMVPVVIDPLSRIQVLVVKNVVDGVTFNPKYVPIVPIQTAQTVLAIAGWGEETYPSTSL